MLESLSDPLHDRRSMESPCKDVDHLFIGLHLDESQVVHPTHFSTYSS